MFRKLRSRLTFANVTSALALFVALSTGGAYAANTILSSDIKDGEVKTPDLAALAVNNAKLNSNAVNSGKVQDATLMEVDMRKVPWQVVAANPQNAGNPCSDAPDPEFGVFCGINTGNPDIGSYQWQNYSSSFMGARYLRDANGIVHLEGLVKVFDGFVGDARPGPIFFLPRDYRPAKDLVFPIDCKELADDEHGVVTHGRIDILSDGAVLWNNYDNCDPEDYLSLSGISFRAD
jgi:hypothetical protein